MNTPTFRSVPLSHGWLWIRLAFRLYRRRPIMWIAYATAIVSIGAVMALVPMVGGILFQLIAPILTGGLMLACRDERRWQPLHFMRLFDAFKSHGEPLVTVGGVYLTGMLLVFTVPDMVSHDPVIQLLYAGQSNAQALQQLQHMRLSPEGGLLLLGSLLVFTLLLMSYWFAPTLVLFQNQRPFAAFKLSFQACAANFPAFLLYGFVMFTLLLLATVPAMLGFLIIIPVGFISYYTSYRDVFRAG